MYSDTMLLRVHSSHRSHESTESAYRSGEPLGLSRHVLADGQADPLVKLAVDALPDAVFSKGKGSYGMVLKIAWFPCALDFAL